MNYQIDTFSSLVKTYSTWNSLQAHITSAEGGNIRVVGEGRYRILRYVKGVSDLSFPYGKWMRSVVWDTETNRPVCVAPPKAEKGDVPTGKNIVYPLVQDFLDGMMINVFRTVDQPNILQVTTRTQLGAGGKFYSEKTFDEMFTEALTGMRTSKENILNVLAVPTQDTPYSFASFVLQHPEHRVVARCRAPHTWIVHTGTVCKDATVTLCEDNSSWPAGFRMPSYPVASETNLNGFFSGVCGSKGWFYQGMTFKDGKGNRWRMRNPNYLYLRSLRGSEATDMKRFLRLRSESKVTEYLKHYGEDRQTFWDLEQLLRKKTADVFTAYCQVHKSHEKKLEDIEWAVKPCVFKLHSHYLEHLRPNNEKVYMKHAVELVNNLQLFEQARLLTPVNPAASNSAGMAEESAGTDVQVAP